MLKGKTTIELTDVNTGEKKVYEDHNMVTNALKYIFSCDSLLKSWQALSVLYPIYENALGGILLFDEHIDENNGDTIFAPTNVEQIGCASKDTTSSDNVIGSYNSSESYYNSAEKTMKYVYDFATNQANGTIKSVCLTSKKGGFSTYGNANIPSKAEQPYYITTDYYDFTFSSDSYGLFCFADYDANVAYYCKVLSTTEAVIYERELPYKRINLFSSRTSTNAKSNTSYSIDLSSYKSWCPFYDKKQHAIYIIGTESSISAGAQFKVSKINLTTKTVENMVLTNDSGVSIRVNRYYMYIYDGVIYFYSGNQSIYMIDIYGEKTTKKIGAHYVTNYEYGFFLSIGDRIYFGKGNSSNGNGCYMVYNPELDTLYRSGITFYNNQNCIDFKGGHDLYYYLNSSYSNSRGFYLKPNYLATINNLETPITKTNTNTMKVIYTIKEE